MKALTTFVALVAFSLHASTAQAQWDPMSGVNELLSWFTKLNDQVDKVVISEKRQQLIRSIDRLRKDLYSLEADTRILRDVVPTSAPSDVEIARMEQLTTDLKQSLNRLVETSRTVGADLRLNEADEVESLVMRGLRSRVVVLSYMEFALRNARAGVWDADAVRNYLDKGIADVGAAQKAVSAFQRQLASKTPS